MLTQAAAEALRHLREFARSRSVVVRLAEDLPTVEVDAAVIELCLTNYVSNAIKYSDPARAARWVAIRGRIVERSGNGSPHQSAKATGHELVVEVRDNGLGVPEAARARLFERFYRAHEESAAGVEGTGLGLSLVRETVELRGGRAWAEFDADGSCFAFALPLEADAERGPGTQPRAESYRAQRDERVEAIT